MTDEHGPLAFRVEADAAFGVNSLGLGRAGFPFAAWVSEYNGVHVIGGVAARVVDLVDVLEPFAQPVVTVQSLGHHWFDSEDLRVWRAAEIAREQGVEAVGHDVTWAGHTELLALRRTDLSRFLAELYPYNIDIVDAPGPVSAAAADELALAVGTRASDGGVLAELPCADLHFSGHDDCYFHIESRDPALPARVFARLLTLAVGSALVADGEAVTVVEPHRAFVDTILARSPRWWGPIGASDPDGTVRLDLAAGEWRPGVPVPTHADLSIRHDPSTGDWQLTRPESQSHPHT
ncbi:hypothetical protein ACIBSV_22180 [Embleya sp. NPDC050154]|uniref:hypothetical protein n=1 Tax=Embleya sp. NPDC050154 TaxID=3363988 RepID=UPI0037AC8E63